MQYGIYLDGTLASTSPVGMPEDMVRKIVEEALLEQPPIAGVVEIRLLGVELTPRQTRKTRTLKSHYAKRIV